MISIKETVLLTEEEKVKVKTSSDCLKFSPLSSFALQLLGYLL